MKHIQKWVCLLLAVAFLSPISVAAHSMPSVSARCAVLLDASCGTVLYGKNEHIRRGMASTTKIMTAILAIEQTSSLDKIVTVAPAAVGVEGSSVYLCAGEQVTMETLLYALMLQSANDAAVAIAYEVAGSVENFADMMNEKAKSLGLCQTHFENPHGLDGENHYTTAYELAKLAAYAMENERFSKIVSTKKKGISLHDGNASRLLINHNRLLHAYSDVIGVKTGFTRKCGRTLVSAAQRDGVCLICVTLDDGNDWQDHRALLDYGFSLYERETIAKAGAVSYTIPVVGGTSPMLAVTNVSACEVPLRKDHGEITTVTELPRFVYGGVSCGERIGTLRFFENEREIGTLGLFSISSVGTKQTSPKTFWQKLLAFFGF